MNKLCAIIILFILLFLPVGPSLAQEPKKILSIEAYDMLNTLPDTFVIDVRTRAEYQFVGHPVGAYLFPFMFMSKEFKENKDGFGYQFEIRNNEFINELSKVFQKTNNLIIIGRDGVRSALAAKALVGAGFENVYDVADGFEGGTFPTFEDPDMHKFYLQLARRNKIHGYHHRRHNGWQWWGLPWTYEINPKYIYPPDLSPAKE